MSEKRGRWASVSFLKDVRALGTGLVPRGLYEVSKRSGLHTLAFRPVSGNRALRLQDYPGDRQRPSSYALDALMKDAQDTVSRGVRVFGRRHPIRTPQSWLLDPCTQRAWPNGRWWEIDARSTSPTGDAKWIWEIGRHRDLVILARAHIHLRQAGPWLECLVDYLQMWFSGVRPERSIHWYSNLEISLRLISWLEVISLVGRELPEEVRSELARNASQAKRHLLFDLPYTWSSMRNNHMLGDALGIFSADQVLSYRQPGTESWLGRLTWNSQFRRQFSEDGGMIEDSLSYHRFVLEMLCVRRLFGDRSRELLSAIRSSSTYLVGLGVLDGPIPQYGDWDEGRVLASSGDPLDVGNSVALGLVLSGESVDPDWVDRFDLLAWYAPTARAADQPRFLSLSSRVGDIAMARRGGWQAWLKCGSGPSHGHADLGHVSVRYCDQWLVVDPGTGTYNGPLEVRNGFRVSAAHNVLRPLGEGQIEPHRAFRWMSTPTGRAGRILEMPSATVLWGAHDAYVVRDQSPWPWRIARAVVLTDEGLAVIDWRENDGQTAFSLTIPLSRDCTSDGKSITVGADRLALRAPGTVRVAVGEKDPFFGWDSPTYGTWAPAPWVVAAGDSPGPVTWSVGSVDTSVDADVGVVGGLRLAVTWSERDVRLSVEANGQRMEDVVPVGRVQ